MFERHTTRIWNFAGNSWELGRFPKIMGIVNITPDSFSDGGSWDAPERALQHALELVEQGADLLDLGGESTRPGATPVSATEELRRVIPVIEQLSGRTSVPISIDTMKADVAQAAISAGASIINDVSGFEYDAGMIDVAANSDCGVILMHMQGTPHTMQNEPYYADVVREVSDYLSRRIETLVDRGIATERIVIDPGIGFGKSAEHNLDLLTHVAQFHSTGRPVLVGHSRKRFLGKILGRSVEDRLAGTVGVSIALAQQHTDILRVHDVRAVKDAVLAWDCLQNWGSAENI